jgi:hypothetical protein
MHRSWLRQLALVAALAMALLPVGAVADVQTSLSQTEGRRQVAENGLRDIKKKSAAEAEQVRERYSEAAVRNNEWLDALCQAIQQGSTTAPDVATSAEAAAVSLIEWAKVRNRALGIPEMNEAAAASVKRMVVRDLTEIAKAEWTTTHRGDEARRTKAATTLKGRLRWKPWEEIQ